MEDVRPRSYGGGSNPHVNVRTINNNKMWIVRTTSSHEPSPRKERNEKKATKLSRESDKSWWKDPEVKRKCRVAKYKLYAAEGKLKHSLKAGIRWLKIRCIRIVKNL